MRTVIMLVIAVVFVVGGALMPVGASLAGEDKILAEVTANEPCAVCGMLVAKYPGWVAQVRLSDGKVVMFDGPKDMLAYYFAPAEYGAGEATVTDIVVRDYYSQKWIDGRAAVYVVGSDVYGPMGSEFVPFESREAATSFAKDHRGERILTFEEVDMALVQNMRKMHKKMNGMKK